MWMVAVRGDKGMFRYIECGFLSGVCRIGNVFLYAGIFKYIFVTLQKTKTHHVIV